MSWPSVLLPCLISLGLTAALWLRVAIGTRRSAFEHYGSRLLLQAAGINVVLCAVLVTAWGMLFVWRAGQSGSTITVRSILCLATCILPVRVLWIYLTGPARLYTRFRLQALVSPGLEADVARLARMVGVAPPRLVSSPQVAAPFVFGKSSQSAVLAVPQVWSDGADRAAHGALLHELAHIRNGDVGFMTWAQAFRRDVVWALLLLPAVLVLPPAETWSREGGGLQVASFYGVCVIELAVLCAVITRQRERLADQTVALMLSNADLAGAALAYVFSTPDGPRTTSEKPGRRKLGDRLQAWLADRALFGRQRRFWRFALRLFEFLRSTHPPVTSRTPAALQEAGLANSLNNTLMCAESIWVGMVIGTLGASIALAGSVLERFGLGIEDRNEAMHLTGQWLFAATLPVAGLAALLFALPGWSSLKATLAAGRYLGTLCSRYALGLMAAIAAATLLLLGGWSTLETRVLAVATGLWCVLVMLMALVINLVLLSFWLASRYWDRTHWGQMLWMIRLTGPGLLVASALIATALIRYLPEQPIMAVTAVAGGIVGLLAVSLLMGRTTVSGTDQYAILRVGRWQYGFEGPWLLRWGPWVLSLVVVVCFGFPGMGAFLALRAFLVLRELRVDTGILLVAVLVISVAAMLFLHRTRRPWSPAQVLRRQTTLRNVQSITRAATGLPCAPGHRERPLAECSGEYVDQIPDRVETVYEWAQMLEHTPGFSPWLKRSAEWLLLSEAEAGFGLWPQSSARLCSTSYALEILNKAAVSTARSAERHARWIRQFQQRDGGFRGPWSRRPRFEDTYFAVRALELLHQPLLHAAKKRCGEWVRGAVLGKALATGRPEAICYGLRTLRALREVEPIDLEKAGDWARRALYAYALANIMLNAQSLLHTLRVLCICLPPEEIKRVWTPLLENLTRRAETALAADLERPPCPFSSLLLPAAAPAGLLPD